MRRSVEKHLEDPLAEHLLRGDVKEGDLIAVSADPEEKRLKFEVQEGDPEQREPVAEEA